MAVRKPLVLINGEKQLLPDTDSVPNADKLDGKTSTYFATAVHTHMISDVTNLQTELDNKSNINHNHDDKYLGKTEKAADADKLDGNDSTYFATAADLTSHTTNTNNPHNVTAAQLGAANILAQIKTVDGAGSGLDADTLDGYHASSFLQASSYTASDVLTKIKTVDGSGSGLDADLLDGKHASSFALSSHTHNPTDIIGLSGGVFVYKESSEMSYTQNSILSWTPTGISRVIYPFSYLVCKVADKGYNVGDRVYGWGYAGQAGEESPQPIYLRNNTVYMPTGDYRPRVVVNVASAYADWNYVTSFDYWRIVLCAICLI
jgi:hypothetical protein